MAPFSDGRANKLARQVRAHFKALQPTVGSTARAATPRTDDLDPLFGTTTAAVNGETARGASNMRHALS